MWRQLYSSTNNLERLLRLGESCHLQEQLFEGRDWKQFKRALETHFELFTIEEDCDRLMWLILRFITRVKIE